MNIEKIMEKLKEVLSEEDLTSIKDQVSQIINEEAKKRSDVLVEEKTKEIQTATEKFIEEAKEEFKKELTKDYDLKLEQLEERLIADLDQLIDLEIKENISDELLTKIAINETLEPVINGIKKVFTDNHLELDIEGTGIVKKLQEEKTILEKQLSESIAEKMTLNEEKTTLSNTLEKISVKSFITEKVEGLKDEQKERIVKMFESKSFKEVQDQIEGMIDLVIKEENEIKVPEEKQTIVEGDGIKTEKKKIVKEEYSAIKIAKNLV